MRGLCYTQLEAGFFVVVVVVIFLYSPMFITVLEGVAHVSRLTGIFLSLK